MEHTIKAILFGRCDGDLLTAWRYCMAVGLAAKELSVSLEYLNLATIFRTRIEADREQLQRTRTVFAAGCSA